MNMSLRMPQWHWRLSGHQLLTYNFDLIPIVDIILMFTGTGQSQVFKIDVNVQLSRPAQTKQHSILTVTEFEDVAKSGPTMTDIFTYIPPDFYPEI